MKASFNDVINSDQPVLVDFFAEWCGPCHAMKPILEEAKRQLGESVRIVKIDVDKNPQASAAYQIRSIPTLILFHKGKSVWRQSGVVQANQISQIVQQTLQN